jgi:predicted lipid-binding transport protein (Tim44 family)
VGVLHRTGAAASVMAGTYFLAGPGWALLVLGAMLWLLRPPAPHASEADPDDDKPVPPAQAAVAAARARTAEVRAAFRAQPRRGTAVVMMGAAVAGVPVGVGLLAGLGAAVLAGGLLLLALSLLVGWHA